MPLRTIPLLVVVATLIGSVLNSTSVSADDMSSYGAVRISDSTPASGSEIYYESSGSTVYGGGYYGAYPSPDTQFAPPQNYPINRTFFYYRRYYPDRWYGQVGSRRPPYAPMVYHPTDTTQLGYYYQHVPVWQPNPNMLPREPHPATWHNWGRLPAEMVWHREGKGKPKGIVHPPGMMNSIPTPQADETIEQKQPLPLQPKRLVPPTPKTAQAVPPQPTR